jgi:hypothetical protein
MVSEVSSIMARRTDMVEQSCSTHGSQEAMQGLGTGYNLQDKPPVVYFL